MPLRPGVSSEVIHDNIKDLIQSGHPTRVAVAAALREAHKYAVGGATPQQQGQWWQRNRGEPVITHGLVPGPTAGRADLVKVSVPRGCYVLPADIVSAFGEGNTAAGDKYLQRYFGPEQPMGNIPMVPVSLSGGEWVVSPAHCAQVGRGDLKRGHDVLDALVKKVRADHKKTLGKLPGPVK